MWTCFARLAGLYLRKNQISDISALAENTGIGAGNRIELEDNPLNDEAYSDHIPALQGRGASVGY